MSTRDFIIGATTTEQRQRPHRQKKARAITWTAKREYKDVRPAEANAAWATPGKGVSGETRN